MAASAHPASKIAAPKATPSASAEPLLALEHVSFSYDEHLALDDVSLSVNRGETVALVGPNGCGKSTILRLCVGLDTPTAGELRFCGQRVDQESMANASFAKRLRQRIGFVFQDSDVQLFCPTVRDEISFGPRQMGLPEAEIQARTNDCLNLLGINDLADRAPYQLSGGEKKRVAVACVVSLAPDLLLLDEPTNALDEEGEARVINFLQRYVRAGHSVLFTTHHRDLVSALSARVVRMDAQHHICA
ncbi:MAG: ABC transporter ATP-binding protein [Coriobacteriales bacterium]|nr:ABC transporter ATP-binding protein [Coriobacteriales bacterium]